jgi:hypothetical protein
MFVPLPLPHFRFLVDEGADVDGKGKQGIHSEIPLVYCCLAGTFESVKLLVGCGADLKITGTNGYSPMDILQHERDKKRSKLKADYLQGHL